MELPAARGWLGLGSQPSWADVRAAYRAHIAAAHPDRAGGDVERALRINEAYATLERAHLAEGLGHGGAPEDPSPPAAAPAVPPEVLDGDTVHLAMPPDEAFRRMVEACHEIGDVTYLDASCAILEALVRIDGQGVCSLVITLQGRADGTDAFCTLEAIERVASPPVGAVVHRLVTALRRPSTR